MVGRCPTAFHDERLRDDGKESLRSPVPEVFIRSSADRKITRVSFPRAAAQPAASRHQTLDSSLGSDPGRVEQRRT
jgi:hypothetical protein